MQSERGMSLVEATIILMVLAIVTAVLSPSINEYIDDARGVKAKEDVETIGIAIVRLLQDTGFPFLVEDATIALVDRYKSINGNRADLAVGSGNIPSVQSGVVSGITSGDGFAADAPIAWTDTIAETSGKVSLYNQLVANTPGYPSPVTALDTANPAAPGSLGTYGLGWRGAYIGGVLGPDPWGFRYACSTLFLGTYPDADSTEHGSPSRGWAEDAVCLSAGRNTQIETNFWNAGGSTSFSGTQNDDVICVISGFGR